VPTLLLKLPSLAEPLDHDGDAAPAPALDHAVHGLATGQDTARVAADGGYTDQSNLHRDVVAFTGLTPATVVNEPFLAVDDIAWGWPGPRNTRGGPTSSRGQADSRWRAARRTPAGELHREGQDRPGDFRQHQQVRRVHNGG
jgi:hypothetical protein